MKGTASAKMFLAPVSFVIQSHLMPTRSEAEEHLRVIRSLMERATVYRAISAPGAAFGGVLAIAVSFAFGNWWPGQMMLAPGTRLSGVAFILSWLGVLLVTAGINFWFIWREAEKRGDPFFSPGMRMAQMAVLPSYVVAAFFTVGCLIDQAHAGFIVPIWIICHGVGLLATSHFAPRSFAWLGWAFLLAGLCAASSMIMAGASLVGVDLGLSAKDSAALTASAALLQGQLWMASTFGLFHLVYAVCTWPGKTRAQPSAAVP